MTPAEGLYEIIRGISPVPTELTGFNMSISQWIGGDFQIAFLDQPGSGPETATGHDYPSVQVLCRGNKSATGYTKAYNALRYISRVLHLIPPEGTDGLRYPELVSCVASTGIASLGSDTEDRPQLSTNFRLIIAPTNPGNRQ